MYQKKHIFFFPIILWYESTWFIVGWPEIHEPLWQVKQILLLSIVVEIDNVETIAHARPRGHLLAPSFVVLRHRRNTEHSHHVLLNSEKGATLRHEQICFKFKTLFLFCSTQCTDVSAPFTLILWNKQVKNYIPVSRSMWTQMRMFLANYLRLL